MSDLTQVIKDLDVNAMFLSTAVTRVMDPAEAPSVKTIAFGGEINTTADYERWKAPGRRVYGVYGPTECCVYCAVHDPSDGTEDGLIGRPMSSVGWVVDPNDHTKLAPLGCVGELAVEGPTLALAYLNQPERTAASFPSRPTWLTEGSRDIPGRRGRLYLTGDLVTMAHDGIIKYIGRKDRYLGSSPEFHLIGGTLTMFLGKPRSMARGLNCQKSSIKFVAQCQKRKRCWPKSFPARRVCRAIRWLLSCTFSVVPAGKMPSKTILEASRTVSQFCQLHNTSTMLCPTFSPFT